MPTHPEGLFAKMEGEDATLYDLLGVSPNASLDEIKEAYRIMVLKCHPRRERESDADEGFFLDLSEAATVLFNDDDRKRYNQTGMSHFDAEEEVFTRAMATSLFESFFFCPFFLLASSKARFTLVQHPLGRLGGPEILEIMISHIDTGGSDVTARVAGLVRRQPTHPPYPKFLLTPPSYVPILTRWRVARFCSPDGRRAQRGRPPEVPARERVQ